MRCRVAVALVLGLALGLPLLGAATPAQAANDAAAKLCQKGGWQDWVRADQTPFVGQSACVSYSARGGVLTAPQPTGEAVCASYGGSFGNNNLTMGSWSIILWTCNGWSYVSQDDWTTTPPGSTEPAA